MTELSGTAHPTAHQRALMAQEALGASEPDPDGDAYAGFLEGVPDPVTLTHAQLQKLLGQMTRGIMNKAQEAIDFEVAITDRMAETLHEMVLSRNGDLHGRNSGKPNRAARALALDVYRKHRRSKGLRPAVLEVSLEG